MERKGLIHKTKEFDWGKVMLALAIALPISNTAIGYGFTHNQLSQASRIRADNIAVQISRDYRENGPLVKALLFGQYLAAEQYFNGRMSK